MAEGARQGLWHWSQLEGLRLHAVAFTLSPLMLRASRLNMIILLLGGLVLLNSGLRWK